MARRKAMSGLAAVGAAACWLLLAVGGADATIADRYVSHVLAVFVSGGDHLKRLRIVRDQSPQYPAVVAALTDYRVFGHGTLLDLLFEEDGEAVMRALDEKLKMPVACLSEYAAICQASLADRNQVILSALSYYDQETRSR